jgi:uncharacterized membrane protein
MKKYFITGLVILLPLALTFAIVVFFINLLTDPFVEIVKSVFGHFDILESNFFFISADQQQRYASQLIILILLFFFIVGLGVLARWFLFHYFIKLWEYVVHKIPFVSPVYKTCQDVIKTIFASESNSFKQVVLVPFPSSENLAIGLLTRDNLPAVGKHKEPLTAVFVPTTPNPTSGFLMMFAETDLVYIDMKVEDALKYVISCGVIGSPIHVLTKEEAKKLIDTNNPKEVV